MPGQADSVKSATVSIGRYTHDALGRQRNHYIGQKQDEKGQYLSDAVELQESDYNIRGWKMGMVWKTATDNALRKYDFSYDLTDRVLKGAFEQQGQIIIGIRQMLTLA